MRLETKRLYLRPLMEADHAGLLAVLGDAETMNFYPQPYSAEQVTAVIQRQVESYERARYGLFAVVEKASGALIGSCGITIQHIDGTDEHEIGYQFAKSHWGCGYAPEAAEAIKAYGFEPLGLKRLCSYMASDHTQSRRVAEKIGMQVEKEYRNPKNRDYLTTVYAIHSDA